MDLLADENVETEWLQALRDDGHDVLRVVDVDELGPSATDPDVLAVAARLDRVLLTADQSDFADPPMDDHAGIIIVADVTRTGGGVRRSVRRIENTVSDLSNQVAYVTRGTDIEVSSHRSRPRLRDE